MPKEERKSKRKVKLVIWRNVIAAIVILSLIVARQAIIQVNLDQGLDVTRLINSTGRQRMLSQRIAKDAYILFSTDDQELSNIYKIDLELSLDQWETSHQRLVSGQIDVDRYYKLSSSIVTQLEDLYPYQMAIREASLGILSLYESGSEKSEFAFFLETILENENQYLSGMETVVSLIENESERQYAEINTLETVLFYILLVSVLIQIIFIFLPGQKNLYKSFEKVQYLGDHDRLTGLLNQFSFSQRLSNDVRNHKNHKKLLALLLVDIDGFSRIKEMHGQLVADDLIKRMAEDVQSSMSPEDYAARLINDEFAIITLKSDRTAVENYAKSLQERITGKRIPVLESYSAGMGIALYHEGEAVITWLDRATTALQQAKEEGKNRIVCERHIRKQIVHAGAIPWSDEWNSGNAEIDKHHNQLLQLGNELISASLPTGDSKQVGEMLEKISAELMNHFIFEESLLRQIEYPEVMKHAIIHEELTKKLEKVITSFENQQLNASYVFSFILDDIIVGHIGQEDTKYFPYIKLQSPEELEKMNTDIIKKEEE